ncbi:esterase/lipase family protein [Halobacillus litoralis]|uniref:esterase/lipase family protein n=1 Tax=Halobacillus litoralis TaxID=45668 RepID=UPI0024938BB5|nr:alpha/beta hydrolase [Halobacillus litoralis]
MNSYSSQVRTKMMGRYSKLGTPGKWYLGAAPANPQPGVAPLVFIHGINSSSYTWWEDNDMYEMARENGYETAFIDVSPVKDMWDNGLLLATIIPDLYEHFGERLTVIAHSKGGIDTQAALLHYGALPYVHEIITLSSPHHGSQLANLAYSSWASWLADIIGSKNDATFSLQTGYMSYYRSQTDSLPTIDHVPTFTLGGTGWGAFGTSLFWGGLYLRSFGANDGVVTVESSRLPYATEIRVDDWNHYEIKRGSSTFPYLQDYLSEGGRIPITQAANVASHSPQAYHPSYHQGGVYRGSIVEVFEVEEEVKEVIVDWVSNQPDPLLNLFHPDGSKDYQMITTADSEIFEGAYHHTFTLVSPEKGSWKLQSTSPYERYLLSVAYESPINEELEVIVDADLNLLFQTKGSYLIWNNQRKLTADIRLAFIRKGERQSKTNSWKNINQTIFTKIPKYGEGIYNITIDVHGKTVNNDAFNRTIILSVYVDRDGNIYQ